MQGKHGGAGTIGPRKQILGTQRCSSSAEWSAATACSSGSEATFLASSAAVVHSGAVLVSATRLALGAAGAGAVLSGGKSLS